MEVGDINDDGNDDIVLVSIDGTFSNQYIQVYRGPDPSLLTNQQTLPVPLTSGLYTDVLLGHWGETVQGGGSVRQLAIVKILICGSLELLRTMQVLDIQ